jgi:hypothetical protein
MEGSSDGFRPHELMKGPGMGELKLTLSKSKEAEEDSSLHASYPST